MPHVNRIVIGVNDEKKSAVILRDSPNHQEVPGIFWRSTLWAATELPVNNQLPGDRAAHITAREPTEDGLTFRALEIPPDIKDAKKHIEILQDLNKKVRQKYPPTEKDLERHPSMHRTDTCDMFVIAYGEIYLMTDTGISSGVRPPSGTTLRMIGISSNLASRASTFTEEAKASGGVVLLRATIAT